ncbi:hypothetical protein [Streptomyces sp. NPDC060194]|uniref:hypothetical protein n=1 Tax=Streptomyces sp. NPDC060194 TaxID=3347069 RepID=UPI003653CE06
MVWVVLVALALVGAEMGFDNALFWLGALTAGYLLLKQGPRSRRVWVVRRERRPRYGFFGRRARRAL